MTSETESENVERAEEMERTKARKRNRHDVIALRRGNDINPITVRQIAYEMTPCKTLVA